MAALSPGGTANGEGGEGTDADGEPMAPTRSWVKEPWKAGEGASGKSAAARVSGPGLVSAAPAEEEEEAPAAKRDSTAEHGGRASVGRGGLLAPSPAGAGAGAEASRAAMGGEKRKGGRQRATARSCGFDGALPPPASLRLLFWGLTGEPRLSERAWAWAWAGIGPHVSALLALGRAGRKRGSGTSR